MTLRRGAGAMLSICRVRWRIILYLSCQGKRRILSICASQIIRPGRHWRKRNCRYGWIMPTRRRRSLFLMRLMKRISLVRACRTASMNVMGRRPVRLSCAVFQRMRDLLVRALPIPLFQRNLWWMVCRLVRSGQGGMGQSLTVHHILFRGRARQFMARKGKSRSQRWSAII